MSRDINLDKYRFLLVVKETRIHTLNIDAQNHADALKVGLSFIKDSDSALVIGRVITEDMTKPVIEPMRLVERLVKVEHVEHEVSEDGK